MSGIYKALAQCMAEVGAVGKNRKNTQGAGYQYRGIDDVMAAVQPIFAANGVVCVAEVVDREREAITTNKGSGMVSVRLLVRHTFYAEDGSSVVCTTLGEAFDSGDKASNKAMAVALKYALTTTLCLPTYETNRDTEEETHHVAAPQQQRQQADTAPMRAPVLNNTDRDSFMEVVELLMLVYPGEEGREERLKWWYARFVSGRGEVPEGWNPAKAWGAAEQKRRDVIRASAEALVKSEVTE
jgi:hypothetical protein